jgi:hypothetical protein
MEATHRDSRHWSQRWMRVAIVEADAVVLYDLHQPVELKSCGRGRCRGFTGQAPTSGRRYRVCRFWEIDTCEYCGRMSGFAVRDRTLYYGDSEEEALAAYWHEEESLMGRAA